MRGWEERESVCGDGGMWGFVVIGGGLGLHAVYFPQNREIQPFQPE